MKIGQDLKSESDYGLRIDLSVEQYQEDKPLIYKYVYSMDINKFQEWLNTHAYLREGPLAFTAKGIQVMVPALPSKWDKSSFSMTDDNSEYQYVNLLFEDMVIRVHRDLFAGKEWEIFMEDSDIPF